MSSQEFVTFRIGDQMFGVSVSEIHDVFRPAAMTPVPLSGPEIAGVLNLRGRIVTAIDARSRLGLASQAKSKGSLRLAIGVERYGESFGLIIDEIGEVVRLEESAMEQNPVNLDATWSDVSRGVYRLEDRLLVIMDIDRMLAGAGAEDAAAAA
ncbi:MAG: chemotaxis protein CheW [Burkholderiales bacterium]|nr:MAG: chemotaxis protein CheW [Burkholderiales bacterium]